MQLSRWNVLQLRRPQVGPNRKPTGPCQSQGSERKEVMSMSLPQHKWFWCDCCEVYAVACGTCGNNTCNGGYGEVDGKECPDCESAYQLFFKGKE